jgi:hypothetical protein
MGGPKPLRLIDVNTIADSLALLTYRPVRAASWCPARDTSVPRREFRG